MISFKITIFHIFFTFILFFVNFYCNESKRQINRHKRYEMSDDDFATVTLPPEDDTSPVEVICSREFRANTSKLHAKSVCRFPRLTLVPIQMPTKYYMPGVHYRPNMIEVKRCVGECQPPYKCLPIEKELIEVPVIVDDGFARLIRVTRKVRHEKCMRVKIEQHITCRCNCPMTQQNCNDKQLFSPDRCACLCKDATKANTCKDIGKMWSNENCDCVCPPSSSRTCSSGAVFDEEMCR